MNFPTLMLIKEKKIAITTTIETPPITIPVIAPPDNLELSDLFDIPI